jgi:hypothetical protein
MTADSLPSRAANTPPLQRAVIEPGAPDLEAFIENVSRYDGVEATAAAGADACGAIGCRVTEYLAELKISGFGTRVVCPIHTIDLVRREVSL